MAWMRSISDAFAGRVEDCRQALALAIEFGGALDHALLELVGVAADRVVQPRVLDGDSSLAGNGLAERDLLWRKLATAPALPDVGVAEDSTLDDQGDNEPGSRAILKHVGAPACRCNGIVRVVQGGPVRDEPLRVMRRAKILELVVSNTQIRYMLLRQRLRPVVVGQHGGGAGFRIPIADIDAGRIDGLPYVLGQATQHGRQVETGGDRRAGRQKGVLLG